MPDQAGRETTLPFSCCDHCGCGRPGGWPDREGHDDICIKGCNDEEMADA